MEQSAAPAVISPDATEIRYADAFHQDLSPGDIVLFLSGIHPIVLRVLELSGGPLRMTQHARLEYFINGHQCVLVRIPVNLLVKFQTSFQDAPTLINEAVLLYLRSSVIA